MKKMTQPAPRNPKDVLAFIDASIEPILETVELPVQEARCRVLAESVAAPMALLLRRI